MFVIRILLIWLCYKTQNMVRYKAKHRVSARWDGMWHDIKYISISIVLLYESHKIFHSFVLPHVSMFLKNIFIFKLKQVWKFKHLRGKVSLKMYLFHGTPSYFQNLIFQNQITYVFQHKESRLTFIMQWNVKTSCLYNDLGHFISKGIEKY